VSVRYATADGTAAAPGDYRATAGTLVFAPGETRKTIDVRVRGDLRPEADETFVVRLSHPTGATVAEGRATGTILDDDPHYLVDDFADGDDAGWTRIDFTGAAAFDAGSGAYRLRTAGPLPPDDPSVGTMAATWDGSADDAAFGHGVVGGTVRANTAGTTAGFYLRGNTTPSEDHDYGFYGSSSFGTFYIERFDITAGGQTILAMADPARHPFVAGVDYRIEGGVWGEWVWLRAWAVGQPRPVLPQLVVRDGTFGPEDGLLLGAIAFFDPAAVGGPVQVDATFDDITFRPLPGPFASGSSAEPGSLAAHPDWLPSTAGGAGGSAPALPARPGPVTDGRGADPVARRGAGRADSVGELGRAPQAAPEVVPWGVELDATDPLALPL
jgi:hypothetical protein